MSQFARADLLSGQIEPICRTINDKSDFSGIRSDWKFAYKFKEVKDDFGVSLQDPGLFHLDLRMDAYESFYEDRVALDLRGLGLKWVFSKNHSLYFGKRILIWGKGDQIHPLDVWMADDLRFFLVEDYDQRKKPRAMAIYEFKSGDNFLQLVAAPRFSQRYYTFPGADSPWCNIHCLYSSSSFLNSTLSGYGISAQFRDTEIQDRLEDWEVGARWSSRHGSLDYSFALHSGYDKFLIYSRTVLSPMVFSYEESRQRVNSVGGDVAFSFHGFGFRSEARFIHERPYLFQPTSSRFISDGDGIGYLNELEILVGIDSTFFDKVYANFQIFTIQALQDNSQLVTYEGRQVMSFQTNFPLVWDRLKLKYEALIDTFYGDSINNVDFQYTVNDQFLWRLGAYFIFAKEKLPTEALPRGLLGGLQDNTVYYIRARFDF